MKTPATLLALDGNWLVHRAYHAASNANEDARPRMVARQVVSWAFTYALAHQSTHLLAAFDGAQCFRYEVWPLYKVSRKTLLDSSGQPVPADTMRDLLVKGHKFERAPDPIHECQKLAMVLLKEYGVPVFQPSEHEADDALASAATLAVKHPQDLRKVVVCTPDKDTLQSLIPGVTQWYPNHDRKKPPISITHADLSRRLTSYVHEDAEKWTPLQFRDYQVLIGDATDDVPAITSNKKARAILNAHSSLKEYFGTAEGEAFYYKHQEALRRNHKLVVMCKTLLDKIPLSRMKYEPRPLPSSLSVSPSPQLTGAHADYIGWLRLEKRPSLFGRT